MKTPPFWRDIGSIVVALAFALVVRTVAAEPFNVPSASMVPTLWVGDTLIAAKYAYGFSKYSSPVDFIPNAMGASVDGRILDTPPERGDVIVFKLPRDTSINYVKRVIGLPGDHIRVKAGRLYINGTIVPRREDGVAQVTRRGRSRDINRFIETLPNGRTHEIIEQSDEEAYDNTGEYEVPAGHYFMMGDNRDDSLDSRVAAAGGGVGYVPYENLVGRVDRVMFSRDPDISWWQVPQFLQSFRGERFLSAVQ